MIFFFVYTRQNIYFRLKHLVYIYIYRSTCLFAFLCRKLKEYVIWILLIYLLKYVIFIPPFTNHLSTLCYSKEKVKLY